MGLPALVKAIFATSRHHYHASIARPRPYPYDTRVTLAVVDGGAPDIFGAYAACIPRGTFDFEDSPNRYRILGVILEDIGANDTYIMEFYRSYDDIVYTPIGAVRFIRTAPFSHSFIILQPTRPLNADNATLYVRLKDAAGGGTTVNFSLMVSRFLPPVPTTPITTGVWPTG